MKKLAYFWNGSFEVRLEEAWREISSNDPRDILDKAIEIQRKEGRF
jgi:hypothetical protein